MKRYLLGALGMLLLGTAGLLILHQLVEFPSPAKAQSAGASAPGIPGVPVPAGAAGTPAGSAAAGQYKDLVPALLESLADPDGEVRQLSAATLIQIGPDAVTPLVAALKSKDRDTRANAAYVLGRLGESASEALPALAKALKDDDKEVRRRAAYAMHTIISRSQGGEGMPGAFAMSSASAPPGTPPGGMMTGMPGGSGMRPPMAWAPSMPGASGVMDPGLLVPPMPKPEAPAKMEKEHK